MIVHIPQEKRGDKLDACGDQGILVGYGPQDRDTSIHYLIYIARDNSVRAVRLPQFLSVSAHLGSVQEPSKNKEKLILELLDSPSKNSGDSPNSTIRAPQRSPARAIKNALKIVKIDSESTANNSFTQEDSENTVPTSSTVLGLARPPTTLGEQIPSPGPFPRRRKLAQNVVEEMPEARRSQRLKTRSQQALISVKTTAQPFDPWWTQDVDFDRMDPHLTWPLSQAWSHGMNPETTPGTYQSADECSERDA